MDLWRGEDLSPFSVVMGNVRSLSNKMDELTALTRSHPEYCECSLMCFTETWLHRDITDQNVSVEGFHTVRADRDCTESGKWKGGGLAVLVNCRRCYPGHITIKEQLCSPDVEILAPLLAGQITTWFTSNPAMCLW